MRCPKCGYNSFDHNLTCPKCRKDLSAVRRLLNLTVPAPGLVDFFQYAGQRQSYPQPFIETGDMMGELEPAMDIRAIGPAAPYGRGYEPDITSLPGQENEPLEEIYPDMTPELEEITPMSLEPQPPAGPYAGSDEEIEIEIDDLTEDIDQSTAVPGGPQQMAMAQITTALTETGDLSQPSSSAVQGHAETEIMSALTPAAARPPEEPVPSPDQTFGPQPYVLGREEPIEEIALALTDASEVPVLHADLSTEEIAAPPDEFDLGNAPNGFDLETIGEQSTLDIEPENPAESLETMAAPPQAEAQKEAVFGAVEPVFGIPSAVQPMKAPAGVTAAQDIVPPMAVPGIPALPTVPPDTTMSVSLPSRGLESDDFSSLVDDLNLEDLDEKL